GAAAAGEGVVLRAAVVLGGAPFAFDEAIAIEAAKGREQRAGVHAEDAAADLLDAEGDAVAMERLEGERLEDQHVECALDEIGCRIGHCVCSSGWSRGAGYAGALDCQEEKPGGRAPKQSAKANGEPQTSLRRAPTATRQEMRRRATSLGMTGGGGGRGDGGDAGRTLLRVEMLQRAPPAADTLAGPLQRKRRAGRVRGGRWVYSERGRSVLRPYAGRPSGGRTKAGDGGRGRCGGRIHPGDPGGCGGWGGRGRRRGGLAIR